MRSFIIGIIERSAIDGQKVYHAELERCMRAFIRDHKSDFLPEGVDAAVVADAVTETTDTEYTTTAGERGIGSQDATSETSKSLLGSTIKIGRVLEAIQRIWHRRSGTTMLWVVIIILVLCNLWTLRWAGSIEDEAHRKSEVRRMEMQDRWLRMHRAECCPNPVFDKSL